jgi:NhaA family Na+:H+ antiporter
MRLRSLDKTRERRLAARSLVRLRAAVRLGWCQLSPVLSWGGVVLVGLLAGIGFTMSIFIAMLAFSDADLLKAAKLGVLLGSLIAAMLGLAWGISYVRRL